MIIIIRAIFAGLLISIGGCAYLCSPIPMAGAFMFATGLLVICITGQYLYTGRICFLDKVSQIPGLCLVLLLNIATAYGIGWAVRIMKPELISKAFEMCSRKLTEGWFVIPLGILCNILIFFAVKCHQKSNTIGLIMCVMAFILCGFEHCVANAFYFGVSGIIGEAVVSYLGLNVIGNTIGGLICALIEYTDTRAERKALQKLAKGFGKAWQER